MDDAAAKTASEAEWRELAKNLLKSEMKRRGANYDDLVRLLATVGLEDNSRNLSNKVNRGTFSAAFFLQCLRALGANSIHLD